MYRAVTRGEDIRRARGYLVGAWFDEALSTASADSARRGRVGIVVALPEGDPPEICDGDLDGDQDSLTDASSGHPVLAFSDDGVNGFESSVFAFVAGADGAATDPPLSAAVKMALAVLRGWSAPAAWWSCVGRQSAPAERRIRGLESLFPGWCAAQLSQVGDVE